MGWALIQCWALINFPPYRMGAYLRLGSQNTINTIGIKLKRECFISYLEEQVGKSRYNCTAKFFLTFYLSCPGISILKHSCEFSQYSFFLVLIKSVYC